MKNYIKKTSKSGTYGTLDFKTFYILKSINNKQVFVKMTIEELERKTAYKDKCGFILIEAENLNEAKIINNFNISKRREAQNDRMNTLKLEEQAVILEILKLENIPTTIYNLRLIMIHLNSSNWGSWTLPKMTIGYSAHQYDCDGKIATTVTLDKPIEGIYKFKIGGKRGHLNQYTSI